MNGQTLRIAPAEGMASCGFNVHLEMFDFPMYESGRRRMHETTKCRMHCECRHLEVWEAQEAERVVSGGHAALRGTQCQVR